MVSQFAGRVTGLLLGLVAITAAAQEAPLTLTKAHAVRIVTGPNILGRYEEADTFRVGVLANSSTLPTTATATHGGNDIVVPYYQNAILDDLYEIRLPFDPSLVGPWTITVTRGTETATAVAAGLPAPFSVPFMVDLDVTKVDGIDVVAWTWPDVTEAAALGLRAEADIRVMQEDNYDEYLLRYGVHPSLIPAGVAGERYEVVIPEGFEGGKLFLFRVHLSFYDGAGDLVAQSLTFARHLYAAPL